MQKGKLYQWIGAIIGGTVGFLFNSLILDGYKEMIILNLVGLGLIIALAIGTYSKHGGTVGGALIGDFVAAYLTIGTKSCSWLGGCQEVSGLYGFFGGGIGGALVAPFFSDWSKEERLNDPANFLTTEIMVGAGLGLGIGMVATFLIAIGGVVLYPVLKLIPLFSISLLSGIGILSGKALGTWIDEKAKKHQQYLHTVPGLFDTAKTLSSQANQLFQQKNYPSALQTYENALSYFTRAHEGAKVLNDTELTNSISNNISALRKNIAACKNALGAEIASNARSKFENGDFTGAIQTYEEYLKYSQDAELISKTKANIENCYIEIDARKVEELSTQAVSLLKEAAALNEPFKARDILKQADNIIDEAVSLATKRKFTGALSQLNAISKNIRAHRDIVYDRLSGEAVVSGDYKIEPITTKTSPTIPTLPNSHIESNIKRGYVVLPNNDIKFGIRVTNNMGYTITDVDTILDYNEELFNFKGSKIQRIGNIQPDNARTATYLLKPLGCIHNEQINAIITYKDHTGKKQTLHMRPKEVHCVCPFLKEKPMSEGEYSRLAASSEIVQEGISFKGISVEELAKFMGETCRHMLHKVREYDVEGKKVIYLSGESVGEKAYYLLTAVIQEYKGLTQVVLRAHSDKKYGLNGFMNEMADSLRHLVGSVQNAKEIGIIENTQVINIIDSVVQRTNFNMGEGGSTQVDIRDSMVQRSKIGGNK